MEKTQPFRGKIAASDLQYRNIYVALDSIMFNHGVSSINTLEEAAPFGDSNVLYVGVSTLPFTLAAAPPPLVREYRADRETLQSWPTVI